MSEVLPVAGAGLAWLGAAILVLSDGRRGLALGLLVGAAGIALTLVDTDPRAAGLVAAGGAGCAGLRLRDGPSGWGFLPAGSTPRLILCLVVGAAAAYVGVLLAEAGDPWLAIAGLASSGLAGARLLGSEQRQASLACAALIALGLVGLEPVAGRAPVGSAAVLGVLAAILLSLISVRRAERAA